MSAFRNKKYTRLAVTFVAALCVTSCATIPNHPPKWLEKPSLAAPETNWWVAAAKGRTRAEAIDTAMIRLAQRVEARVIAVERFTENAAGAHFERRGTIHTNARLIGAETLAAQRIGEQEYAALVGFDPVAAGKILSARVHAALDVEPPKITREIGDWIEQGAVLAPAAVDWDALRALLSRQTHAAGTAAIDVPEEIAAALSEIFGIGVSHAHFKAQPTASYRPGEKLRRWVLTATVGGEPRRWTGVVTAGDSAAEAAAARVRAEGSIGP